MTRRARPLRLMTAICLVAICLTGLASSSSAEDRREGRYPGLPYISCDYFPATGAYCEGDSQDNYGWLNTVQNGLAGSPVAKQWGRVPSTVLAVNATFDIKTVDPLPGEIGRQLSPAYSRAFFVSPGGSGNNYGDSSPITIRTVAFGSIPVEITLQVSQRRDARNLPIPIQLDTLDERRDLETGGFIETVHPTELDERLNIRVRRVVVDGVDTRLGGTCETGPTAALHASSGRFERLTPPNWTPPEGSEGALSVLPLEYDPAEAVSALLGGTLKGSLNIPRFNGCTTRTGDDLSPLLSSAISGSNNPITLQVGALSCAEYEEDGRSKPPAPGSLPKDLQCFDFYPFNPKITALPHPLDIPDYAPGDQPDE